MQQVKTPCDATITAFSDAADPGKLRACELPDGHAGQHMATYCGEARHWGSHAAKDWMQAVEDPSKMLAAKNMLWLEAHRLRVERDELLAEIEQLKSAEAKESIITAGGQELTQQLFDELEEEYVRMRIEARKHADSAIELQKENERLKRELDASVAHHAAYRSAIDDALLEPRGNGDIKTDHVNEILRIRSESERLKSELAAAPRWVPVGEHVFAESESFIVTLDVKYGDWCEAFQDEDGIWRKGGGCGSLLDGKVLHVLENLSPPIINQHPARATGDDPRGDGYEPTADCCGPATVQLEEGEKCPECDGGTAQFAPAEDCRCHISPPCDACVANRPRCDNCGTKEKVVADTDVAMNYEQMASAFDSVVDRLRAIHTPPKGWVDPRVQREIDDASTKPVVRDAIGQDVREGDVMSNSTY